MGRIIERIVRMARNASWKIGLAIRSPKYNSKVFCIGFQKTGTTTIGKSLEILGYRNATYSKKVYLKYYLNNQIVKILEYTAKFDSVDDLPWLKKDMIPILDRVFPNSKFIYLTRDEESWKKSYKNWRYKKTGNYPTSVNKFNEFKEHREFVHKYFKSRPKEQLLILNVTDENGFEKLADFLGKKAPYKKLPHYNKTEDLPFKKVKVWDY